MPTVLAGTKAGIIRFSVPATGPVSAAAAPAELAGREVWALAPESWSRLWAVAGGDEIWHTDPAGDWQRVASLEDDEVLTGLTALCLADTRANPQGGILVGTSEAHLARVGTDGQLELVGSFEVAPGRDSWHTPWGGPPDTRSITEDAAEDAAGDAAAVYVNVHVGGVLRSRDEGATWEPTIDIDADIHRVVTGRGQVYAAGAGGLWVSEDQGGSWQLSTEGLHATYCRSVAVCGDTLLVSASDGPHGGRAALYRSGFEGHPFERCRDGLPEWFEGNLDSLCLDALPNGSLAAFATEDGDLYASADQGSSWARLAEDLAPVHCVLTLP
jgi:hypothetical protein